MSSFKFYRILVPFSSLPDPSYFNKIGLDTTPREPLAALMLKGGYMVAVDRNYCDEYLPWWYPSRDEEMQTYKNEIIYLKHCVSGTFGYKKQIECDVKETYERVDALNWYIRNAKLDYEDYQQYAWLLEAKEVISAELEAQQKHEFFTRPMGQNKGLRGTQLTLNL